MRKTYILCAMRDPRAAMMLRREMDDAERCDFEIAYDGALALRCMERSAPDILVIDAVLPGVDGLGVIDRMRAMLGSHAPYVIGGSTMGFADEGFLRRGADRLMSVPWDAQALCALLRELVESIDTKIDWASAQEDCEQARELLRGLGMREHLRGFDYLAWAAALACEREDWLFAIGEHIYEPIAARSSTTRQNVERLIRHAIESTMDAVGSQGVYGFFGNTIDPTRGKPTNAQMIGMLAQRLKVS